MPLGVREVLLVMRAKDEASRTIMGVGRAFGGTSTQAQQMGQQMLMAGSAMMGVGAGIGAIGAAGLAFFADATNAAMEYNQQAALTLTQVDQTGVKLEDIKRIGRDVAAAIPAPFEQMQASLFDIFSSMDVNLRQAQTLLEGFSKAAVAGQTDVQTAGRATIAVMNAYKLPVSDLNHVLDVQFQLVRKGVGTYEEFATVLGRLIPSAVRAGQSFETSAGGLAFLTRNGMSAAMSSTSLARAMDAISHPKSVENMEALGIAVKDAEGNFRPLVDIMDSMREKFADMTKPERAAALTELFKGSGGNIQARRFFNLALENFDQFKKMVDAMSSGDVAGAMKKAYEIMFDQPASKAQLLKNRYNILKTEIGDQLLPIFVKLLGVADAVLGFWTDLPEGVKETIVWIGLAISVFMVIAGVILFVGGAILTLVGLAGVMGISIGALVGIVLGFIAVLALVALAAVAIAQNWGGIRDKLVSAWEGAQEAASQFADWVTERWNSFVEDIKDIWSDIEGVFRSVWDAIKETVTTIVQDIVDFISEQDWVSSIAETWEQLQETTREVWDLIKTVITGALIAIGALVLAAVRIIQFAWDNGGRQILMVVITTWNTIWQTISNILMVIQGIINIFLGLITLDFARVWQGIVQIVTGVWNQIWTVISFFLLQTATAIVAGLQLILGIFQLVWDTIYNIVSSAVGNIIGLIGNLVSSAIGILQGLVEGAISVAINFIAAIYNGITGGIGQVVSAVQSIVDQAATTLGNLIGLARDVAENVVRAIWNGIQSLAGWLKDKIAGFVGGLIDTALSALGIGSPSKVFIEIGQNIVQGLVVGIEDSMVQVSRAMNTLAGTATGTFNAEVNANGISAGVGINGQQYNFVIVKNIDEALASLQLPGGVQMQARVHLEGR